jgi:hypothetical protein
MKLIATALVFLLLALPVSAADLVRFEAITVDATAGGIAIASATTDPSGTNAQANRCSFTLEVAAIRYRWDGTAPTATVGELLSVGQTLEIGSHEDARRIRFIRDTGVSGELKGHCWRQAAS